MSHGNELALLVFAFVLFWAIPVIMLIIGLVLLATKRKPKAGKILLIISGVWLVIGLGVCGAMLI